MTAVSDYFGLRYDELTWRSPDLIAKQAIEQSHTTCGVEHAQNTFEKLSGSEVVVGCSWDGDDDILVQF